MPSNARREWHERVQAVEREFEAAALAVEAIRAEVQAGRRQLPHPLERNHLSATANHLPGTYLIRVVAVFEAALRSYWDTLPRAPSRRWPISSTR